MFSQYEPNVKATFLFLKLLKVKVNQASVNEVLQDHPDWPSLLCISDSLNKWNIPNAAGKIDTSEIDELPTPFMAYTNDITSPLAVIVRISADQIQFYQHRYDEPISEDRDEFIKKWSGIYLLAEPNGHSGEAGYRHNRQMVFFNRFIPAAAFIITTILSFIFLYGALNNTYHSPAFTTGVYLQYFILLAGLIITSLLLWYEIDTNNPLLQKVCASIKKGSCSAILTGPGSKVFKGLSWSEVGFSYFAGGLFILLLAGHTIDDSILLLAWMDIIALPYVFFSIYYQWQVARQWCLFCLAVQVLFLAGAVGSFSLGLLHPSARFSFFFLVKTFLFYLLPALLWFSVKPYILQWQQAKTTRRQYLRIKFNTEIFQTLLKKQKRVTGSCEGLGIDLGNPFANNTLIKICNPYCGPCAKAHEKIDRLLETNADLKVKIMFAAPDEPDNVVSKAVRHLLAINGKMDALRTQKALDDWYLQPEKNYDLFAAKYPLNGELLQQSDKMEAMRKWCVTMEISFTPTVFINGYRLPEAYSIEDLEYFLQ